MSKKHYVDEIDDMDDSTYSLLGSRLSKLTKAEPGKDRFRERRASDRDYYAASPRVKRLRDRPV